MYRDKGLYSGLYGEPSQLAYLIFPAVVFFICSEVKKYRKLGWLSLILLLILSPSSTLITISFLWIIFRLIYINSRKNILLLIFPILAILAIFFLIDFDIPQISNLIDRIDGVFISNLETSNISSMVYLQGFQDAMENFYRTKGFGLGANMMGCTPLPEVPARDALYLLDPVMQELNISDGSFIAAKLVSEFGALGIFILIFILIFVLYKLIEYKKIEYKYSMKSMQLCILFALMEIVFIRSTGYFSGTFFLIFTVIGGLKNSSR